MSRKTSEPRRAYRLTIAYVGTGFAGWQRQKHFPTVQAALEEALQKIYGEAVHAEASGRTDTGVHARAQVVSIIAPAKHAAAVLGRALNANLPETVRVRAVACAPPEFHARFCATGKTYEYLIENAPVRDPFRIGRCWHIPRPLAVGEMRRAAKMLVGRHDFASLATNPGYARASTVRTIKSLRLIEDGGGLIRVRVTADGFLYRMVRNIVGALVKVGHGKLTPEGLRKILEARTRQGAPNTAPACGLYLDRVYYGKAGRAPAGGKEDE